MQENSEQTNDKTQVKTETETLRLSNLQSQSGANKPAESLLQVDEEIADLADEYVRFVSECFGYEVSHGEVANEIYKSHFARDGGFKQWRAMKKRMRLFNVMSASNKKARTNFSK